MRRATLTAAAAVFAAIATAAPAPVANQLWVTNKIDEVVGTNTAAKIASATNATLIAAKAYTDASITGAGSVTPQTVTNIVESVVTNAAAAVVVRDVPAWARSATPPESMTDNAVVLTNSVLKTKGGTAISAANINGLTDALEAKQDTLPVNGNMYMISVNKATTADIASEAGQATWANTSLSATSATYDGEGYNIKDTYLKKTDAASTYYPKTNGDAWSTYWDGDDVRVTVTNYDSEANISSLYLEQKTNEVALATNLFKTVWREMAHWEKFLGTNWNWNAAWSGFQTWKTTIAAELDEKADKAWGYYNSHTGNYSPDGYTVISSSNIMIAANMSYQKTVTTSAEVWVLTANELYEPTGISTNGGFQIRDGDGNVQFEIIKGDKTTVAAQANAVTVDNTTTPNTLVVTYNIIAGTHPTAEVCLDLTTANWKAETAADCPATVTWSGTSGAYVARIQPNASTTKCFCKATYQRGGETYINNRCAVGMSQLVLNGTTYNLGTATIDGNTVLTLTPAN